METNPFVIDVTEANFNQAVLENSTRVPVLVDFWAPWCGPCRSLLPIVTRLAEEYAGEFVLAKINIDEQPALATRFGVRSVPTVKLIKQGNLVDEFMGALPDSAVREFLDRHIEKESDRAIAAAFALQQQGQTDEAARLLEKAQSAEPDSPGLMMARAALALQRNDTVTARTLLAGLPASAAVEPEAVRLAAQLDFAEAAAAAPPSSELETRIATNPRDSEARYYLAARQVAAGNFEPALEQLMELVRRDRGYGEDAGRKGLLKLFEILGDSELVSRYRRQMFNALH